MSELQTEREQRVTPLELFFDLVFVFGFTQVTTVLSREPTWRGLEHGLLILVALWWAWAAYAWLTNTVDPEEGLWGAKTRSHSEQLRFLQPVTEFSTPTLESPPLGSLIFRL